MAKVNVRRVKNGIGVKREGHDIWLYQVDTKQSAKVSAKNSPIAREVEKRAIELISDESFTGDIADLARMLMTIERPDGEHMEIVDRRPGLLCPACDRQLDMNDFEIGMKALITCKCGVIAERVGQSMRAIIPEGESSYFEKQLIRRSRVRWLKSRKGAISAIVISFAVSVYLLVRLFA